MPQRCSACLKHFLSGNQGSEDQRCERLRMDGSSWRWGSEQNGPRRPVGAPSSACTARFLRRPSEPSKVNRDARAGMVPARIRGRPAPRSLARGLRTQLLIRPAGVRWRLSHSTGSTRSPFRHSAPQSVARGGTRRPHRELDNQGEPRVGEWISDRDACTARPAHAGATAQRNCLLGRIADRAVTSSHWFRHAEQSLAGCAAV